MSARLPCRWAGYSCEWSLITRASTRRRADAWLAHSAATARSLASYRQAPAMFGICTPDRKKEASFTMRALRSSRCCPMDALMRLPCQLNSAFRSATKARSPAAKVHAPTNHGNQCCRIVQSIADGLQRHPSSSRMRRACSMPFRWRRCSRYCDGVASQPLLAFISVSLAMS